jgi:tetratricopeptide (TPR) repeat protein
MATRHEAHLRHATYYRAVLAVSNDLYRVGGDRIKRALSFLDSEWSNIQIAQRWAEANMNHDEVASSLCITFPLYGGNPLDLRLSNAEHMHWLYTAVTAARQSKNRKAEGALLGDLALYLDLTGDKQGGINCGLAALEIMREQGNRTLEATMVGRLGQMYAGIGDYEKGLEFLESYLKLARELCSLRDEAGAFGSLGVLYSWMGDTNRAIAHTEEYLRIARKLGDARDEAFALGNLARAYEDLGDDAKAITTHQERLAIARELRDPYNEGSSLLSLSMLFGKQNRYELAISLAEEAVRIHEKIKHDCYYRAINHLLDMCHKAGVLCRESTKEI